MERFPPNTATEIGCPDRLLTLAEVQRLMSLSRSTIYRMVEDGRFPKPLKIGHTSRWPSSEVDAFIVTCKRDRTAPLAQLSTTAIYADAIGKEEQDIAARMWG